MFLIIFTDRAAIFEKGFIVERGFIVSNGTMFAMHDVRTITGPEKSHYKYYKRFKTFAETSAFDAKSDIIYVLQLDSKDNSLKIENMLNLEERTLASTVNGKGIKKPHMYFETNLIFKNFFKNTNFTLKVLIHSP